MNILLAVFAFGEPEDIEPNRRLASIATSYKETKMNEGNRVFIVTQEDINLCRNEDVFIVINRAKSPPSTLEIAQRAAMIAREKFIDKIIVIAALPHLWRALRDTQVTCQEEGLTVEIMVPPKIARSEFDSWFCESSTQKRVRSRRNWLPRELILRRTPWWIYKKNAK